MLKFCPNLHFMYLEHVFLDRFAAAAGDGFSAVEMTFPYDVPARDIARAARSAGVEIIGLNTPSGELVPGSKRGIAALAGREADYLDQIRLAIDYAHTLEAPAVLTMASIVAEETDRAGMMQRFKANLERASALCADAGLTLMIEPHNLVEHPGYLLATMAQVREIMDDVKAPNLKCLFDFYHTQINESDAVKAYRENTDLIGHVQIADTPDRHEPGTGEMDFTAVFSAIEASGYDGWVAGEYFPASDRTVDGYGWIEKFGLRRG